MRLWSIHPKYLDAKGLVALWRETLLAQKVLQGQTKGYKHHPQLIRFKETTHPLGAVAAYLSVVADEADQRGYNFNHSKINGEAFEGKFPVSSGQLAYEFNHLLRKLETRDPAWFEQIRQVQSIDPHPLFQEVEGAVESWEVV